MPKILLQHQTWEYHTWGDPGSPAVLLLHGFTGSHASWSKLAEKLQEQYFVVAPDLPGHGLTDIPENWRELRLYDTADRLNVLLNKLSLSKVAVLGYSMGGRLALHLAHQHPSQVMVLILESASPGLHSVEERANRRIRDFKLAEAIESQGMTWFVDFWANQPLFEAQSASQRALENDIRRQHHPRGLAQSLRGAGTGEQESLWDILPLLQMPVLVISGTKDVKFTKIAEVMARAIPDATRVAISLAGHTVHSEQPASFYDEVNQFLAERLRLGP